MLSIYLYLKKIAYIFIRKLMANLFRNYKLTIMNNTHHSIHNILKQYLATSHML